MALAAASYDLYQAERHSPAESMVDWHAVLLVGHQILRGSQLLRGGNPPGALAPWRDLVLSSADRVAGGCAQVAGDISRRRTPRVVAIGIPDVATAAWSRCTTGWPRSATTSAGSGAPPVRPECRSS